jgi:peptide/nickel transport system substrate-binding protein
MRLRLGAGLLAAVMAGVLAGAPAAAQSTLRIGLQGDSDALDPATGGSIVGRIMFAALCDKLIDVDANLNYVPQLATSWEWGDEGRTLMMALRPNVVFHDGTPFNAEAVRVNLERYRSAPESQRKTELRAVTGVDVVDPLTVRIRLSEPQSPLLAVLSDRAGMMMSPRALAAAGDQIGNNPVCAGPYRFVERVQLERVVVERFPQYWNAAAIHIDRIIYLPIPNNTVRLANLRAGALDLIERVQPTDLATVRAQPNLRLVDSPALGYYTMSLNVAHGPRGQGPLSNPLVREALEASIDRNVINQVVMDGQMIASNQPQAPGTTYYNTDRPVPPRDVARARQLLAQAGMPHPTFVLYTANAPVEQQVGEVIQAMAAEAGFDVRVQPGEGVATTAAATRGDYDASIAIWSGRADPDANVTIWIQCDGFINWGQYCNHDLDALFAAARRTTVIAERQALYRRASAIYLNDRPHLFLYHLRLFWAMTDRVQGFQPHPDSLIRLQGMRLAGN